MHYFVIGIYGLVCAIIGRFILNQIYLKVVASRTQHAVDQARQCHEVIYVLMWDEQTFLQNPKLFPVTYDEVKYHLTEHIRISMKRSPQTINEICLEAPMVIGTTLAIDGEEFKLVHRHMTYRFFATRDKNRAEALLSGKDNHAR